MAGVEPVEERGAGAADVQRARGRGREPDTDHACRRTAAVSVRDGVGATCGTRRAGRHLRRQAQHRVGDRVDDRPPDAVLVVGAVHGRWRATRRNRHRPRPGSRGAWLRPRRRPWSARARTMPLASCASSATTASASCGRLVRHERRCARSGGRRASARTRRWARAGRAGSRWAARRRGRRAGRPATPWPRAGAPRARGWSPGGEGPSSSGETKGSVGMVECYCPPLVHGASRTPTSRTAPATTPR